MSDKSFLPGSATLVFSTVQLADFVQSYTSVWERLTPIAQRQNLWCPEVLLDGSFPAQLWTHTFLLYAEAAERAGFINSWYALEDNVFTRPATLTLNTTPATISNGLGLTSIDFGACYLEPPDLEEPSELLLFRAGLLRVTFLGTIKPTVNTKGAAMSAFSNFLEQALLGVTLLGSSYTAPSTVYLSLATSISSDGDIFEEVPTATGYAQVAIDFSEPTSPGTYSVVNSANVTFSIATTTWGTIAHIGIHDAASAGNLLYSGNLDVSRTINTNDTFEVEAGNLAISLT